MDKTLKDIEDIFKEHYSNPWVVLHSESVIHELLGEQQAEEFISCPQISKWHPEGSLYNHMERVFGGAVENGEKDLDVYWAILFHDIGKSSCMKYVYNEDGSINRTTFHGHDLVSARKAMEILVEFEMDVKRIKKIVWLIAQHMRIAQISKMKTSKVEELVNHKWIKELMRLHNYDDMINVVSPDCVWIENYLKEKGNCK